VTASQEEGPAEDRQFHLARYGWPGFGAPLWAQRYWPQDAVDSPGNTIA